MPRYKGIIRLIVLLAAILLNSCRIYVTPVISVSDLQDPKVRTIPVLLSTDTPGCGKEFLDKIASQFNSFHNIVPSGCFNEGGKELKSYWETTIPLLRKGDEGKIPYLPGGVYYSENNSIIAIFNPSFYGKLRQYSINQGVDINNDITITFQIKNNTKMPMRVATQSVFVNGNAIGNDMNVFELAPGSSVWIRMSNVGVNSLLIEGIEPIGVMPAHVAD